MREICEVCSACGVVGVVILEGGGLEYEAGGEEGLGAEAEVMFSSAGLYALYIRGSYVFGGCADEACLKLVLRCLRGEGGGVGEEVVKPGFSEVEVFVGA